MECPILEITDLQSGIQPPSACGAHDGDFSFGLGVSATGGTPPYNFILTDYNGNTLPMEDYGGWGNLGAGYYHLAIIDNNGCRGEVPFTIEGEDVEISYGTSPECEHRSNGTIWLQAYVPAPGHNDDSFHYEWSTGDEFDSSEGILLEGLAAGQYTVTVTSENSNCSYTETIAHTSNWHITWEREIIP
ncbi:MAG: hypothetical protein H6559_33470 [Lewinellaceae bacterium]|nr:hypothetical protein [Lewinellaceae bacterium]